MLGRNLMVSAAAAGGILVVLLLHSLCSVPLVPSQICGIVAGSAIALGAAASLLRRKVRGDLGRPVQLSWLLQAYLLWPYFTYGCLYYLFLFCDRWLAWTAGAEGSTLPLQFRGDYEAALDVALISFILQAGWVHCSVVRFYRDLVAAQQAFGIRELPLFNTFMARFYRRRVGGFAALAATATAAVAAIGWRSGFLATPVMAAVTGWTLAGFPFVVLGLWNVSLLFALSQPVRVLRAIGAGCLANLTTGYLASRIGSYPDASIGFLLGALLFAALSTQQVLSVFHRLDFYNFASSS
jgi:hypothetical protein